MKVILTLALFSLFLGCLQEPSDAGTGSGSEGDKSDFGFDPDNPFGSPSLADRAFFLIKAHHLSDPGWPGTFSDYSLFVASPSLTLQQVSQIHSDVPGSTVLAYTNAQDIPLGLHENVYYQDLEAAFDSSYCVWDLTGNEIITIFGHDDENVTGIPAYVMRRASADALVGFHRDETMTRGFDGLYVDMCTQEVPNWRLDVLSQYVFDIDDDGIADTLDEVTTQYRIWRPYFLDELRFQLGDEAVLVGNAGGPGHSALNGITLESVGTRFTVQEARTLLSTQRTVGTAPHLSALWAIHPEDVSPTLELVEELDWVRFGEVH